MREFKFPYLSGCAAGDFFVRLYNAPEARRYASPRDDFNPLEDSNDALTMCKTLYRYYKRMIDSGDWSALGADRGSSGWGRVSLEYNDHSSILIDYGGAAVHIWYPDGSNWGLVFEFDSEDEPEDLVTPKPEEIKSKRHTVASLASRVAALETQVADLTARLAALEKPKRKSRKAASNEPE